MSTDHEGSTEGYGNIMLNKHKQIKVACLTQTKNALFYKTKDIHIRSVLVSRLEHEMLDYSSPHLLIEELGVSHGAARVDVAVVNGLMHGYEIKSDLDTLQRLPDQIEAYGAVFDKMTIVVGLSHLHEAMYLVPDWWGVIVARVVSNGDLHLNDIRKPHLNRNQESIALAKLLWREEAMKILEERNEASGLYSKPRKHVYMKLANVMSQRELGSAVRETLCLRENWRVGEQLVLSGG